MFTTEQLIGSKLTKDQHELYMKLLHAISYSDHGIADILQVQNNEDIEAVLTAYHKTYNDVFTLSSIAIYCDNDQALQDILNVASKIKGLERRIFTEFQYYELTRPLSKLVIGEKLV